MRSFKAIQFRYRPTGETKAVLEIFRMMVNHAIAIGLEEEINGRLKLRDRIYKEFQERYGLVSCYPYSVAEVAWSIVKKHRRWQRRPVAEHLMMKMDSANYSLNYGILSLPYAKGQRILISLEYGDYQRSFLADLSLKRGSMTMTEHKIVVVFSKETTAARPLDRVGIDLNEKSAVLSDGMKYDLSEVARLHTEYGIRRSEFFRRHSHDKRLKKKFSNLSRENNRVRQVLGRVSKEIVWRAKKSTQTIVLERLNGIRYVHQKGSGRSRVSRRRVAQWPFNQLQRQIEYKAGWVGVQVEYVNAAWTSKTCNRCNYVNRKLKLTDREWLCPFCGANLDRDLNAAINIERRGKIECLAGVRPGARGA